MYSFDSRVRYSETDRDGKLAMWGVMNYLQDCSTFQSEDIGVGIHHFDGRHLAWYVYSWYIIVKRFPVLGERIRISTWPYRFRGIFGYRNFMIEDEKGEKLVLADSTWFLYDWKNRVPARPLPEDIAGYGAGERLDMPEAGRRMKVPEGGVPAESVRVMPHHLDVNRHVNNAQYVEIARECIPEDFPIREIRAEYRNAAVLGDVMIPYVLRQEDGYVISLRNEDNGVFAHVKFGSGKEETV